MYVLVIHMSMHSETIHVCAHAKFKPVVSLLFIGRASAASEASLSL